MQLSRAEVFAESHDAALRRDDAGVCRRDRACRCDPGALCTGGNGGYQGVNLAVLFGVARIVLLGYDLQLGPAYEEHWHPPHLPRHRQDPEVLEAKLARFRAAFVSLVEPLRAASVRGDQRDAIDRAALLSAAAARGGAVTASIAPARGAIDLTRALAIAGWMEPFELQWLAQMASVGDDAS